VMANQICKFLVPREDAESTDVCSHPRVRDRHMSHDSAFSMGECAQLMLDRAEAAEKRVVELEGAVGKAREALKTYCAGCCNIGPMGSERCYDRCPLLDADRALGDFDDNRSSGGRPSSGGE